MQFMEHRPSLCGLQLKRFRNKFGIIEGGSDRPYICNSFHCHVSEDITPIEKQDCKGRVLGAFSMGKNTVCTLPYWL